MSEKKTCCARVNASWLYKGDPCGRTAKVERDGKWYCGTHDPVRLEERRKERREADQARWDAERAAHRAKLASAAEQKRRSDCYDDLLEALEELLAHASFVGIAPHYETMARAAIAKARGEEK